MPITLDLQSNTQIGFTVSGTEPTPAQADLKQINVKYGVGTSLTVLSPIPASGPAGGAPFSASYTVNRPSGSTFFDVYLTAEDTHGNQAPFTPAVRTLAFDLTAPDGGVW